MEYILTVKIKGNEVTGNSQRAVFVNTLINLIDSENPEVESIDELKSFIIPSTDEFIGKKNNTTYTHKSWKIYLGLSAKAKKTYLNNYIEYYELENIEIEVIQVSPIDTLIEGLKKEKISDYKKNLIQEIINGSSNDIPQNGGKDKKNDINIIYFGAPGTGKSHTVKELKKKHENSRAAWERITFHPEYDYASFVGGYMPTMVKQGTADVIQYRFKPQVFTNIYTEAWLNPNRKFNLVIEEINRGNCAEIFGDIFQLLDRDGDYDITPSPEMTTHLENKFTDSNILVDSIKNGSKMRLPSNLALIATMNTSDQSLFPMDSAFKRRWEWEYIPINYDDNAANNPSAEYMVELDDNTTFSWIKFLKAVNNIISKNQSLGMDKCMGNYFIKPDGDGNTISLKSFINKVIFYLWNDVFKDEDESVFGQGDNRISYESFFKIEDNGGVQLRAVIGNINELNQHPELKINIDENIN